MGGKPNKYDVSSLERALENAENVDAVAHELYNNLGLAHAAAGRHRAALRAHRAEKQACKRLVAENDGNAARLLDLSIAYRHCGDATLKVNVLTVGPATAVCDDDDDDDESSRPVNKITARVDIARSAFTQHEKALNAAVAAHKAGGKGGIVEVQASLAAMAQSALAVAHETREEYDYDRVASLCARAVTMAEKLSDNDVGGHKARFGMTLSASVNLASAISGLGDKKKAKRLFQATGVRARHIGDKLNLIRCIANLAEEADDDGDWPLCIEYVDEWITLAKSQNDDSEEADALRKRGTVLFEMRKHEDAREALDRAALLARDVSAREEALKFLHLVELEIEEIRVARETLETVTKKVSVAFESGDVIEEARLRLSASEAAFTLLSEDTAVFDHLSRYFALVDEYGCSTMTTGVDEIRHCSAVANMAEVHWRGGRFGEAVEWGMRELAVYADDLAGQSQAWCNIGIYLEDSGKHEKAKDALNRSIALAEEAGDKQLRDKAELNLNIIIETHAEREQQEQMNVDSGEIDNFDNLEGDHSDIVTAGVLSHMPVGDPVASNSNIMHANDDENASGTNMTGISALVATSFGEKTPIDSRRGTGSGGELSIVVNSDNVNGVGVSSREWIIGGSAARSNEIVNGLSNQRRQARIDQSLGAYSTCGGNGGDRSSAGSRRYMDLSTAYRKRCMAVAYGKQTVEPRALILEKLRTLSAKLITGCESDVMTLDVSASFLGDDEFIPLFESLAALPVNEPQLSVNLRLNPLLTPASICWLAGTAASAAAAAAAPPARDVIFRPARVSSGPPRSLQSIVSLNLSGTGLDAASFGALARALNGRTGTLPSVATLDVGKNGLGGAPALAADAVARLLTQPSALQTLDLSLNLLSNTFLSLVADNVERLILLRLPGSPPCGVYEIDLSLNNRRAPTALLEAPSSAVVGWVRRLIRAVPSLGRLDVRASGGVGPVRRGLFELREELIAEGNGFELVVASPEVYDEEEDFVMNARQAAARRNADCY
jgi:tetratricopeptide (TPR) repeat protein